MQQILRIRHLSLELVEVVTRAVDWPAEKEDVRSKKIYIYKIIHIKKVSAASLPGWIVRRSQWRRRLWSERSLRTASGHRFISQGYGSTWWPLRDIYGWIWVTSREKIKTFLWMLLFSLWPLRRCRAWLFVLPQLNNGDTWSALNRSLRSVKLIWGPLLFLRRLQERRPDARGLRPMRTSPRSGADNTSFYGVRLPSMSSRDRSANPVTSCASGRGGLRWAHISRSTQKRSEEGFRAVSSDTSWRFTVSGCRSDCTNTYKSRNQSRETGTSSRIFGSVGTSAKYI